MKITKPVGIVSYGAYLPAQVILAADIERAQGKEKSGVPQSLGVLQKTVPDVDEDTITLATAAAAQAVQRWERSVNGSGAVFLGSGKHPYAVEPTGTTVKEALG